MINNCIMMDRSRYDSASRIKSVSLVGNADIIALKEEEGDGYTLLKNRYYETGWYSNKEFDLLMMYVELVQKK